jgi:hypothetical protein
MLASLLFLVVCGPAAPASMWRDENPMLVWRAAQEAAPAKASPPPPPTERTTRSTAEEIRARPRPSDPWSVVRDVPGVVLDRVDVGGSETAQQSLLISRGDAGTGATWTLDGIDITDPAAPGFAALYPDAALAESVDVRTHTGDVRVRTPGVQVGVALPQPLERWTGRASGATSLGQSDNLPQALAGRPFFRSRTRSAREIAADAGGPLRRDRLWLWGAVARRSLAQDVFTEHEDRLSTTSFVGKARVRVGRSHLTLLALRSEKVQDERDATLTAAPEARWRQSGPAHLLALDGRGARGGFALTARVSALRSGFRLEPRGGTGAATFEDFRGVVQRSYLAFETERPRDEASLEASTSRRFGAFDHRLSAGAGYARSRVRTHSAWPGNEVLGLERRTVFFRAFGLTGFAIPTRAQDGRSVHDRLLAHVQDEARRGALTVTGGLRLERLAGHNEPSAVSANPEFPDLLPAVVFGGAPARFRWVDVLPRAAASWDFSDGSSVGIGYAAFAAALGANDAGFDNPLGREVASLTYYWLDRNGDENVQAGELDLVRGRVGSAGLDPDDPGAVTSPHLIDPALRSPRTHALSAATRHTFGAWTGGVHVSWRRLVRPLWRPLRNLALGDYVIRGAVQGEIRGEPYSVGYYAPASASLIVPGNGRVLANREGYRQDAITAEVFAAGRWRRVRLETWAAFTDWREYFPDRERAVQDPTPVESEPLRDGGPVAARPGGLGRGDVIANARFTAGATVRVSLPFRLEATAIAHAREGFPIPYSQVAETGDPTGGGKAVLVAPRLDAFRLPALLMVDARLSREMRKRGGAITAFVDLFNALNTGTTLQVARDVELPALDRPREIVRPRLIRGGVSVRF